MFLNGLHNMENQASSGRSMGNFSSDPSTNVKASVQICFNLDTNFDNAGYL